MRSFTVVFHTWKQIDWKSTKILKELYWWKIKPVNINLYRNSWVPKPALAKIGCERGLCALQDPCQLWSRKWWIRKNLPEGKVRANEQGSYSQKGEWEPVRWSDFTIKEDSGLYYSCPVGYNNNNFWAFPVLPVSKWEFLLLLPSLFCTIFILDMWWDDNLLLVMSNDH